MSLERFTPILIKCKIAAKLQHLKKKKHFCSKIGLTIMNEYEKILKN